MDHDTIAAIATGLGGGLTILRLSGPAAATLGGQLWQGRRPLPQLPPRTLTLGRVAIAGESVDRCLAVYMPAPHSYTGEDVVELHCHGGPLVARTILAGLLAAGARLADPGEFTRRAFLNGKLDLTQAEAVLDVIQAQSDMALHAANRQLAGTLGRRVETLYTLVTEVLAEIEARLDFADEELDWQSADHLRNRLTDALGQLVGLRRSRHEGEILRQGVRMVLAGPPNAGKSSLLNCILGRDRAIVTDIPGTTRDTLEELAHIRGIPIQLVDTAGIRSSVDTVEQHGIARSLASIDQARLVLWLIDSTRPLADQPVPLDRFAGRAVIFVLNKADLVPDCATDSLPAAIPRIRLSAVTGEGLEALYDTIERLVWGRPHAEQPDVAISTRHDALLADAQIELETARELLAGEAWEVVAVTLRTTLDALGRITGRSHQPDLLDTIFSKFCIGK